MAEKMGTAVVTGASSGIGALYADRLAHQGYDLVLVARNAERLERIARSIREQTGRTIETITADLILADDVNRVASLITDNAEITMLINNAGVGATAPLLQSDANAMSVMIALNVEALVRLTHAAVPGFVARGRGTIINIASIVAITPERLNGVYGGSKAFVLAFSQSLRQELEGSNVHVQVVLPGATATDFWDAAGLPVAYLPEEIVMPAGALVDAALLGLSRKEFVTIPSLHDVTQWDVYEAARQAMAGNLSTNKPAARYLAG
ncbi:SDR family NAD(P)-dependent oxidoreductase [Sinorhizobium medicae]|nr:SDR family NAD(P)-dependent oxidoreductase [Sinorhizobium medicae]MDX0528737.1 SDR family NAD(P)-dependent oxidoreductase [Sinorhizobium medicae]MDX0921241.1 SDR family NAD(P)-dependent oxidoreductase [Sinorhizobium medicae]MDX0935112.1 SDR family NAD(P)-dependent oxidoreductase [Sinorhizobium medicae]MDX0941459.1 SDR family NAD(P)-dependent oxidoreductase [Sinorhizobium medicae]